MRETGINNVKCKIENVKLGEGGTKLRYCENAKGDK